MPRVPASARTSSPAPRRASTTLPAWSFMGNMLLMPALRPAVRGAVPADAVAQAVRDGVAAGELVPEQTYSVYQLAELLGVSRSPVREGLLRLAEAGLVEIIRNRGFRVLPPRAHDIEEIIGIRLALEPPAARLAAEQATDEQHAAIRAALDAMAAAAGRGDDAAFWPADRALHDLLLRASGKLAHGGHRRAAAHHDRPARPADHGQRAHPDRDPRRARAGRRRRPAARRRRRRGRHARPPRSDRPPARHEPVTGRTQERARKAAEPGEAGSAVRVVMPSFG